MMNRKTNEWKEKSKVKNQSAHKRRQLIHRLFAQRMREQI